MNLTRFLEIIFLVCGFVSSASTHHQQKRQLATNVKSNLDRTVPVPRQLHKYLDASCTDITPPFIKNGIFLEVKTHKIKNGNYRHTRYMLAVYKCQDGTLKHIFCSKKRWTGKKPLCSKTTIPTKKTPDFPVYIADCSHEQRKRCNHFCVLLNGEPLCSCPLGFKRSGNHCVDINECEDPVIKVTCKYGCLNHNGSYECLEQNGQLLSDAPAKNSQQHEEYDEDDYDDDDYDEESYDSKEDNKSKKEIIKEIDRNTYDYKKDYGKKIIKENEEKTGKYNKINKLETKDQNLNNSVINDDDDYEDEYDDEDKVETKEAKDNTVGNESNKESDKTISSNYDDEYEEYDDETNETITVSLPNPPKIVKIEENGIHIISGEDKNKKPIQRLPEEHTTSRKFDIIYDEEYDYDYDDAEKQKNNTNIKHETTEQIFKESSVETSGNQERIDTVTKEYNTTDETLLKLNNETEKTNDIFNITNILYNVSKNTEDGQDYLEGKENKDRNYVNTKEFNNNINISETINKENEAVSNAFDKTTISYSINKETEIDKYDETTSTAVINLNTPSDINSTLNINDKMFSKNATEIEIPTTTENEYTEDYDDELTDSILSTTLKIETTTSELSNSLNHHLSTNAMVDKQDIDEISNNLSPMNNLESNKIDDDKNSTVYDEDYDKEEDVDKVSGTKLVVSEMDKNRTVVETKIITKGNIDNILTTTTNSVFDTTLNFVTSTRRIDELDNSKTISSSTNRNEIDRQSSDLPITTTDINDDEYDYDGDDYDSDTEESTVLDKQVKKCENGYKLNEKGECIDIDECFPETNPCSDNCENTAGSYICTCSAGFKLNSADPHTCQDIDECEQSPCSHICKNLPGSFRCECPQGLTIQNSTCVNLTCSQGQTRINGILQCTCAPGFLLGADNRTCEDINECLLEQNCAHNCRNVIGSYECSCRDGYTLERERFCVDIDECAGLSHGCDQLCENTPGSFKCKCKDGYEFKNGTEICVDIDECDEQRDLDECQHICINYQGGYECSCHDGFKLSSDDATCDDVDECIIDNGNCTHICENLPGSYSCSCEENYVLENDNHTCRILDPCLEDNGGCSHECVNQGGVAVCECPKGKGYVLEDKDCYLHDPCVTNNGGCSHICVNSNNAVRCECPKNYELINITTCSKINLCTINNGNCSHFCEFVDDKVNCMCPELYTLQNQTHCIEINPCLENNGGCSHICTFENHLQTCSCPDTHELQNKTNCFEKNPCLMDNGGCSDFCNYINGTLSCSCPKNYYLEGKTCYRNDPCLEQNGGCSHICSTDQNDNIQCLCPDKFYLKDSKTCEPEDPCLINNGNCSHICNSTNISNICSCSDGYKLKNSTHCEQLNPCLMNNGGCSDICENIFGKVRCSCPVNYELDHSNNCVIIDPCHELNGGCSHFCEYLDDEIICSCPDHYNLVNETTCEKVNPCLINNGGCSHECATDDKNNVICVCPKGYELEGKICVPINLCNHKNGGCSHVCSSIEGHIVCRCPPGFELIQKTCFKMNPCAINNGGCSHGCSNNGGEAKCSCPPGYKLFAKTCLDEDPCKKNNGGCSHFCHSKEGKRHCSCPVGYLLRPNKRICKEINECRVSRGGCSHGCKNIPGSYQCTCPQGLQLDDLKHKTCMDVDECLKDNGGCEMICRNFKGGFKCDCPEGYIMERDKRSCRMEKVAQCRVPLAPKNGVIRCWDNSSELRSSVPAGTKCNVWCNEGYKLFGNSQRLCSDSGHWGDKEPQCVVATCPKLPSIQNGWYLPGVCNSGRTYIGESCSVYCRKGFMLREDIEKFVCDPNMNWIPLVRPEVLYNACVKTPANVHINCPEKGQIDFILPQGHRHMFVKIPRPETNVDWEFVTSQPTWGIRLETTLPAGRTEVRFIASSPTDFNSTSSCRLVINVLDKEAPYMTGCPENIERRLAHGEATQIVHWKEPSFYDNVGVATVYKTRESGSEFGSGLHHITYVASDEAGNRAFCHFSIDVRDDLINNDQSNSIEHYSSATYTSHRTAGKYRAVLICPTGVQFMTDNPDRYNNMITSEAGCYWRHVKITKPIQPQSFRVPRIYSESRLPADAKTNRRVFFKWNR